eukprot:6368263-Pyramimonas_sp.AAC.2
MGSSCFLKPSLPLNPTPVAPCGTTRENSYQSICWICLFIGDCVHIASDRVSKLQVEYDAEKAERGSPLDPKQLVVVTKPGLTYT